MLVRYKTNDRGRLIKTAEVYTQAEHQIDSRLIDHEAVKIAHRLQKSGFKAYVVGGAVRDVLLGKRPKDFDLVTDAEPNQIRKIFRNSRIIGKRFRLVHIFFPGDKIIEVSTFRSIEAGTFNNIFGTIEEDALRRDFSINALYYDPIEETIIDFVGGFADLKARRLKPMIKLNQIFAEDPVRMIRAVKYSVTTGCKIGFWLGRKIRQAAATLADVSASRVSEEVFKILQGGFAAPILVALQERQLLRPIMPVFGEAIAADADLFSRVRSSLRLLDQAVRDHGEKRRGIQLSYLLGDCLFRLGPWGADKKPPFPEAYKWLKEFLKPVTPPNIEVEKCLVYLIRKRKLYQEAGALPAIDPEGSTPAETEPVDTQGTEPPARRRPRRRRRPRSAQPQ